MLKTALLVSVLCIGVLTSPSLAAGNTPANAPGTLKVLFIGNSHVFVNNVTARVRKRLQALKGRTTIRAITRGGARLLSFTHRQDVAAAIAANDWDVVVLQEATASFLSSQGRRNFHQAIRWFTQKIPRRTQIVLYQTWPWRADSRYFAGTSSNSISLWKAMQHAYGKAAKRARITIATVGRCWMNSVKRGSLYSSDGNHASIAGSSLAASVIARTIAGRSQRRC